MDINLEYSTLNSSFKTAQSQLSRLSAMAQQKTEPSTKKQKELMAAAQDFEGIFVQQVLEAMDKTIDRDNTFLSGGSAEEYFRSMLNEEVAKVISHGPKGFGLAGTIYRQMSQNLPTTEQP